MMSFYWITRLDSIEMALTIIACFISAILIVAIVIYFANGLIDGFDLDNYKSLRKFMLWLGIADAIFFTAAVFTPTTKEMCAIYVAEYIQDNEDAKEIPDKVFKLANQYLDEQLQQKEK